MLQKFHYIISKFAEIFVDFIQKFTEIRGRAITRILLKISRKFADKLQMAAAMS